ncbi:hypothetical protein ARMGADRAFT_791216 [Armillaria gallica]|uniref:Uncharacterized protein n=1 Tax=Armillaria gallica TaxID=47427 RepID=A0A2H3E3U5_ARMGA|nr:hypothetical protein ARMGADRAFT_791216 [Armillaria gallica]
MSKPSDTVVESSLGVGPKDDSLHYTHVDSDSMNEAKVSQPRREIIWQPLDECTVTLKDISRQFKSVLESRLVASFHLDHRIRVTSINRPFGDLWHGFHRCQGYRREEITLTPMVRNCRVITDTTPNLHELCPICGERVQEGPFNCVCGAADDGVSPTVRCSKCLARGHIRCNTVKSFLCKDCTPDRNLPRYVVHKVLNIP